MMISALCSHQNLFFLITGIWIFSLPSPGIWHFCIFVWIFPLVEGSSYLMFSNTCPFLSNKVHCKMPPQKCYIRMEFHRNCKWEWALWILVHSGHTRQLLTWADKIYYWDCHCTSLYTVRTMSSRCFHCCAKTLTKSNLGRTGVISVHGSQVTLHH